MCADARRHESFVNRGLASAGRRRRSSRNGFHRRDRPQGKPTVSMSFPWLRDLQLEPARSAFWGGPFGCRPQMKRQAAHKLRQGRQNPVKPDGKPGKNNINPPPHWVEGERGFSCFPWPRAVHSLATMPPCVPSMANDCRKLSLSLITTGFRRFPCRFLAVLSRFTGCHRLQFITSDFYRLLPGFRGFYWVLLGYTGFY